MTLRITVHNAMTPLRGVVQDKLSPPNWTLFPAVQESSQRWRCARHVSARVPRFRARREHDSRRFTWRVGSRRLVEQRR